MIVTCPRSSVVEQGFCKAQVASSNLVRGSRGISSVGRAPALQAGCQRFESAILHFFYRIMQLPKYSDFIYQYYNFYTEEECDEVVKTVESTEFYQKNPDPKTRVRNNRCLNLSYLTEFWDNDSLSIEGIPEATMMSHNMIMKAHRQYMKDNKLLKAYMPDYYHKLGAEYFYRYYDESDYYDWHFDASKFTEHVHSYIVYLNDDFEGGDTLFLTQKKRVKPKKGSVLCFTCDFYSIHKGARVTKGTKKILWTCTKRIDFQTRVKP